MNIIKSLMATLLLVIATFGTTSCQQQKGKASVVQSMGYKISGPFTFRNLDIFLVHGEDELEGKTFLTLDEAMEKEVIIVHETGNVNELSIENLSIDVDIFIQAGEIVKGGQQDRVLATDIILRPKSGKVPIDAFCVEEGRWAGRGEEAQDKFEKSDNLLSSKSLKIAVRKNKDQGAVWNEVSKTQEKLSGKLGQNVQAEESESSLQLTLENEKLQKTTDDYIKSLAKVIDNKPDVIGYVCAINGEINSADIYGSNALLKKLWLKSLKSFAVEAVSEFKEGLQFAAIPADSVAAFIETSEKGDITENEIIDGINEKFIENDKSISVQTYDYKNKKTIRKNYLKK